MSFGSKHYQHRFYTTPKVRDRHISDFMMTPEQNHQNYGSLSAFNPYPNSPILENSMKESYLRLVQNGTNSRLYTKDEMGYEGLKFQKDVINRYSGDDYKKNSQILQKFRREAEQSKRNKKYRHLRENSNSRELFTENKILPTHILTLSRDKNGLSFLPITNSGVYHHSSSPQKLFSIKNTQNLIVPQDQLLSNPSRSHQNTAKVEHALPSLKLEKYLNSNLNEASSGIIYEEESHNQNEDHGTNYSQLKNTKIKHSVVRDVGINAHLATMQSEQSHHKKPQSEKFIKNQEKASHNRKKSESLRIETMKLKNKHLKQKYQKLKRELIEKSRLLSHHQQVEEERQELERQKKISQNLENLSFMIHDLCDKLRQNNSKIQQTKSKFSERQNYDSFQVSERQKVDPPKQKQRENAAKQSNNSTQINLLKSSRIQQLLRKQQIQENTEKYTKELEKIESYRNIKPKIIYSLSKGEKHLKNDPLKLLKNRIQEKHFHLETLADYSSSKTRSKTEGY